jgi:hypothetical protein
MKKMLLAVLISCSLFTAAAQDTEVLTNQSVIDLVDGGISRKLILSKISSSVCDFSTDTKSMVTLKKSKVDEAIINAMMEKMASQKTRQRAASNTKSNVAATDAESKPASPSAEKAVVMLKKEGSGIYYYQNAENKIYELESTVFSQAKSNKWASAFTNGLAKSSKTMTISGSEANVQFRSGYPVFYFYFDPENKSLNEQAPTWFASVASPNEFLLIKFENKKSKNSRSVVTASGNDFEEAQGIDDQYKASFKFKRLEKGVYELYFESPLPPGEYGFMYAGATATKGGSSPRVYDFGVK